MYGYVFGFVVFVSSVVLFAALSFVVVLYVDCALCFFYVFGVLHCHLRVFGQMLWPVLLMKTWMKNMTLYLLFSCFHVSLFLLNVFALFFFAIFFITVTNGCCVSLLLQNTILQCHCSLLFIMVDYYHCFPYFVSIFFVTIHLYLAALYYALKVEQTLSQY